MCTVTFLPGPEDGGYLLASNRDERLRRAPASLACLHRLGATPVAAPTDEEAGGTWIGVNEHGMTVCLLNGERPSVAPLPPEPPSRGLLALELLPLAGAAAAARRLEALARGGEIRTRPFRLLLTASVRRGRARLLILDWDGLSLRRTEQAGPALATSSPLDPEGAAAARGEAFARLRRRLDRARPESWPGMVLRFHASHAAGEPGGGPLSVCMHRPRSGTVSRTLVQVAGDRIRMDYHHGPPCRRGPRSRVHLPLRRGPTAGRSVDSPEPRR